jgi:hypothetical protein
MNPNLKGERNEAAKAMLASIHESREKDDRNLKKAFVNAWESEDVCCFLDYE